MLMVQPANCPLQLPISGTLCAPTQPNSDNDRGECPETAKKQTPRPPSPTPGAGAAPYADKIQVLNNTGAPAPRRREMVCVCVYTWGSLI